MHHNHKSAGGFACVLVARQVRVAIRPNERVVTKGVLDRDLVLPGVRVGRDVRAPTAFARVGNAVFLGPVQVLDDLSRRAACFFTRARHVPREYANALRNVRPRRDGQVESNPPTADA